MEHNTSSGRHIVHIISNDNTNNHHSVLMCFQQTEMCITVTLTIVQGCVERSTKRTEKQCFKCMCVYQVPVNPSLYLIKYDGFDCVYGLELHKDERVQGLEVLPDRLGKTELRTGPCRLNTVVMEGCTTSLFLITENIYHIHLTHFRV